MLKSKKNVVNYFGILSLNSMLKNHQWHTNQNSSPTSFSLLSHDETSPALRGGHGGDCGNRLGGERAQQCSKVGERCGRHEGLAVRSSSN